MKQESKHYKWLAEQIGKLVIVCIYIAAIGFSVGMSMTFGIDVYMHLIARV